MVSHDLRLHADERKVQCWFTDIYRVQTVPKSNALYFGMRALYFVIFGSRAHVVASRSP